MRFLYLLARIGRLDLDPMPAHLGRHGPNNDLRVRGLCNRGLWNMCLLLGHGGRSVSFYGETWTSVARSDMDHGLLAHGLGDHLSRTRQGDEISLQPSSCERQAQGDVYIMFS